MDKDWREVGNWSIDVNIRPKLDRALGQFIGRIDDELMRRLGQEFICIVDCAVNSSTIRVLDAACTPRSGETLQDRVSIMVFQPEVDRLSDKAALGEVARAFARLTLRLDRRVDPDIIPVGEHMADNLAAIWGFREEIEVNLAEWRAAERTTRGRRNAKK